MDKTKADILIMRKDRTFNSPFLKFSISVSKHPEGLIASFK